MIRKMLTAQLLLGAVALAQAPSLGSLDKAPLIKPNHTMACPAGTKQVGGVSSNLGAVGCMKFATTGLRLFHGPMISFYASGKVEAVGQTEHGMRSGKWSFYDEAGVLVGETEFKNGDFDGRRVFYFPDGRVKSEERWVAGIQQGLARAGGTSSPSTSTK